MNTSLFFTYLLFSIFLFLSIQSQETSIGVCSYEEQGACDVAETCCSIQTENSFDQEVVGCCPFKNGVCCGNGEHCCPDGYECDTVNSKCLKKLDEALNVPCPDGTSCYNGQTCCPLGGRYGCCDYANAVCCSDGCCPSGYRCSGSNLCVLGLEEVPMLPKKMPTHGKRTVEEVEMQPLRKREWDGTYIKCPNGSQCLNGQTCCSINDRDPHTTAYACCPYYEGICCLDQTHCCPSSHTCDAKYPECVPKSLNTKEVRNENVNERGNIPAFRMV